MAAFCSWCGVTGGELLGWYFDTKCFHIEKGKIFRLVINKFWLQPRLLVPISVSESRHVIHDNAMIRHNHTVLAIYLILKEELSDIDRNKLSQHPASIIYSRANNSQLALCRVAKKLVKVLKKEKLCLTWNFEAINRSTLVLVSYVLRTKLQNP